MLIIYSKEGKQNSWTVRIPVFGSCKKFKYRLLTLRNTDKIPTTQAKLVTIFEKRWLTTYIYIRMFFLCDMAIRPSLRMAKSGGFRFFLKRLKGLLYGWQNQGVFLQKIWEICFTNTREERSLLLKTKEVSLLGMIKI